MSELDQLIADYNRLFESTTNVGAATVCYDRDTWNNLREAFQKIVEFVDVAEPPPE